MEIFILSSGNAYDGYDVKGVYSTVEQANKAAEKTPRDPGDCWKIEAWDLNGEFKWIQFFGDEDDDEE
jgi:hypothetical protein